MQQPLFGLGVFIKNILVPFHVKEIGSFVCYTFALSLSLPDLQRNLFETFFFFSTFLFICVCPAEMLMQDHCIKQAS